MPKRREPLEAKRGEARRPEPNRVAGLDANRYEATRVETKRVAVPILLPESALVIYNPHNFK